MTTRGEAHHCPCTDGEADLTPAPSTGEHPSPFLGQHSEEVFADLLGYDAAQVAGLREVGVV